MQSQNNVQESQEWIANVHGTRLVGLVDLFEHSTKSLWSSNGQWQEQIANVHSTKLVSLVDLFKDSTKFLLSKNGQWSPTIHILNSPTTPVVGSMGIKRKCNNVFLLVIEFTNKNSKVLLNTMEKINVIHLKIEKCCSKHHDCTFKK